MTPQRTDGLKIKIVVGMKSLDALLGRNGLRQSSRRFYLERAEIPDNYDRACLLLLISGFM